MGIELAWYLSCDGDGAHLGLQQPEVPLSAETLGAIARNDIAHARHQAAV